MQFLRPLMCRVVTEDMQPRMQPFFDEQAGAAKYFVDLVGQYLYNVYSLLPGGLPKKRVRVAESSDSDVSDSDSNVSDGDSDASDSESCYESEEEEEDGYEKRRRV